MLSRKFAPLVLAASFLNVASPALACRIGGTSFLLPGLSADAKNKPVVAKVRIVEVIPRPPMNNMRVVFSSIVRVEVTEPIKGVALGQRFVIVGIDTGCSFNFPVDMAPGQMVEVESRTPFIAGAFTDAPREGPFTPRLDEERVFRGDWRWGARP